MTTTHFTLLTLIALTQFVVFTRWADHCVMYRPRHRIPSYDSENKLFLWERRIWSKSCTAPDNELIQLSNLCQTNINAPYYGAFRIWEEQSRIPWPRIEHHRSKSWVKAQNKRNYMNWTLNLLSLLFLWYQQKIKFWLARKYLSSPGITWIGL